MSAREFYGESLKACLEQVKTALGSEALIVETKKVRQGGGLLGLQGREVICVVATAGEEHSSDSEPEETDKDIIAIRETLARLRASANQVKQNPVPATRPSTPPVSQISASALAAARTTYKTQEPPTTRLDIARTSTSKPFYSKASFPIIERPVQVEESRVSSQTTRNTVVVRRVETSAQANMVVPGRVVAPLIVERATPPSIRNLTPLTRPVSVGQSFVEEQGGEPYAVTESLSASLAVATETLTLENEIVGAEEPSGKMGKNLQDLRLNLQQLRARFTDYEKNLTAVVAKGSPLSTMARLSTSSTAFPELRKRLNKQGVAARLVEDLIREIPDLSAWGEMARPVQAEAVVRDLIASRITCVGAIQLTPNHLKTVALIGATGVGKTTTIAKLAAQYALMERKRVALLTIDTYRVAAVEQLKTYSQIMDIPLYVAHEANDIAGILHACKDFDLLLVDTAGRSQLNARQVMELKPFLEALQCETHLVLSASTKEEDLLETANRFSVTRVDRLIFTKLDETSSYGTLLNIEDKTGIPITYLTTGQKVPEDIEIAKGSAIAELILP